MSHRYGTNPAPLEQQIWTMYAQGAVALGLWVAVEDGLVTGHLVAQIQQWDGEWVGWVYQAEFDGPPLRQTVWDHCLIELDDWIREANLALNGQAVIRTLMMVTPHNPKFFERRAGFHLDRYLMRRPVKGEG
jgi:hypothetical protein